MADLENTANGTTEKGLKKDLERPPETTTEANDGKLNSHDTDAECLKDTVRDDDADDFQTLLELVGTGGRWNAMMFFLCSYSTVISAFHMISYEMMGATPDHWCQVDSLLSANWTDEQILDFAIPLKDDGSHETCQMYDYDYDLAAKFGYNFAKDNIELVSKSNSTVSCDARQFNLTQHKSTVVTEWDLVCERRALYSTTQSASQLGIFLGALVFGYLLDRYGRRNIVLVSSVLGLLCGLGAAAAPVYEVFVLFKTLVNFVLYGVYLGLFVIMMELTVTSQRSLVSAMFLVPYGVGYMIIPGIAYFARAWRWQQVAYSVPAVTLFCYFWLLPESPRWLIMQGRHSEALKIFTWAAKVNKKTLPSDDVLLALSKTIHSKKSSPEMEIKANEKSFKSRIAAGVKNSFMLLTNAKMRKRTIIIFFCWFTVAMVYYGVSLNSTNLSANPYIYMFLGGVVEVPSYILLWPALLYLGRRATVVTLFIICAVSIAVLSILMLTVENAPIGVMIFFSLCGKMAIASAFHLVYVYTAELFPTMYRSMAVGQGSMMGRIGSMLSPYINDLLGASMSWGPSALFAGTSVTAAGLALLLPETKNATLPEINEFRKEKTTDKKDTELSPIYP